MKYIVKETKEIKHVKRIYEDAFAGPEILDEHDEEVIIRTFNCKLNEEEFDKLLNILSLSTKQYKKFLKKFKVDNRWYNELIKENIMRKVKF